MQKKSTTPWIKMTRFEGSLVGGSPGGTEAHALTTIETSAASAIRGFLIFLAGPNT